MSYGIETAGDVNEGAVLSVPGFGPVTSKPLLNWRRHMESRFVYSAAASPADQAATAAVKAEIAREAAELKTELSKGPAKLQQLSATIAARRSASLPFVQSLLAQREQAVSDMEALGLRLPDVSKPVQHQRPAYSTSTAAPPTQSATPPQSNRCPKCGGAMVIRTARRGHNKGNKFYGCTSYPRCNGTRPHP